MASKTDDGGSRERHRDTRRRKKDISKSFTTLSMDLHSDSPSIELRIKGLFNYIGVAFIILVLFVGVTTVTFFTIPYLAGTLDFCEWKHRIFVTYIFGATFGHFLLARSTDTAAKVSQQLDIRKGDLDSKTSLPFRAHYCRLCKSVILKHDHHCYMLGKCIGYYNQKYFIWFCGHITVTGFYCLFQTALYLSLAYDVEFPGAWTYFVLLPRAVTGCFAGETEYMELALTFFLYICLIGGFVATGFSMWQIFIVTMGMTTHEALYGLNIKVKNRANLTSNWTDTFGKYWYIGMIFPVPLPQIGDGLYVNAEK